MDYYHKETISTQKEFEALFNYATIGIVVTNSSGYIVNFNKQAETQFGFTIGEVVGKKVEVLLPSSVHLKHRNYRHQFYDHPKPREMGHGRDLFAQKKDGSV